MAVRLIAAIICVALNGCVAPNPPPKPVVSDKFCALFTGYLGRTFSGGLDTYASDLRSHGWDCRVYDYTQVDKAFADAASADRSKIATCGHSFGGAASVAFAERFRDRNLQVAVVALLDGSQPSRPGGTAFDAIPIQRPIPGNVRRAIVYCIGDTPVLKQWACPRAAWGIPTIGETLAVPRGTDHLNIDENAEIRANVVGAMN